MEGESYLGPLLPAVEADRRRLSSIITSCNDDLWLVNYLTVWFLQESTTETAAVQAGVYTNRPDTAPNAAVVRRITLSLDVA